MHQRESLVHLVASDDFGNSADNGSVSTITGSCVDSPGGLGQRFHRCDGLVANTPACQHHCYDPVSDQGKQCPPH
eukprot:CAMPEP_0172757432 /NCGR_PEP_ID=MMETSP1074-20121228/163780_1 /TAXON_ID=2916 /ORGANISM="Ceratium fusus, Strain PA161109" /LENGTH=74 /DNA_ID=CAMNT_0013590851 /DNA_START=108 /DNA_END=332 /DNA_ORIENTATION=-